MLTKDTVVSLEREPQFSFFSSFKSNVLTGIKTLSQIVDLTQTRQFTERFSAYDQLPETDRKNYLHDHLPCFTTGGQNDPVSKLALPLQQYNSCLTFKLTGSIDTELASLKQDVYSYAIITTLHNNSSFLFVRTDMKNPNEPLQRTQYADKYKDYLYKQYTIQAKAIELQLPTMLCWPAQNHHYLNTGATCWTISASIIQVALETPHKLAEQAPATRHKIDQVLIQEVEKEMEQPLEVDQPSIPIEPAGFIRAENKSNEASDLLGRMLSTERQIKETARKPVVFSPPIVSRKEIGIFRRGTINIIQGAYGSHKSRLAEMFAALMLKTNADESQFLGFKRLSLERFCVCYIDTERNLVEELPYAIQGIKRQAGFALEDTPEHFRFTSIKGEERPYRFTAIETFIQQVRSQSDLHLFCLIDVVTDAIGDFNDPKESMKLFDFLGNLSDHYNATFLLVIHQNPGTEKARGHTGTEALNKAITALQISLEKDPSGRETELIKLRYLKLRHNKKPDPLYLQFCQKINGLQLADAETVNNHVNDRKQLAPVEDVAQKLEDLLSEERQIKSKVVEALMCDFNVSNKTIRNRLTQIVETPVLMCDEEGNPVYLESCKEGKMEYYQLRHSKAEE